MDTIDNNNTANIDAEIFRLKHRLTELEVLRHHHLSLAKNKPKPAIKKVHHVLFRIAYFGWDFCGLAVQDHTSKTIEHELFKALLKTCLIESRESSNYHRCGRTDKGVSAMSQVISIDVKSVVDDKVKHELDYCKLLNNVLPNDILVTHWCPVPQEFSARFDCLSRHYVYLFPKGDLNLSKMNSAAQLLTGEHDFRNFCKADVQNGVTNYKRRIEAVTIKPTDHLDGNFFDFAQCEIIGSAFLWHQVRCMMEVLWMVGKGYEDEQVIPYLLDIEQCPSKPQYDMADHLPLCLYECNFSSDMVQWQQSTETQRIVVEKLVRRFAELQTKANLSRLYLSSMAPMSVDGDSADRDLAYDSVSNVFFDGRRKRRNYHHIPLRSRKCCPTIDDKIAQVSAKRSKKE